MKRNFPNIIEGMIVQEQTHRKILRIITSSISLDLLQGQIKYIREHDFDIIVACGRPFNNLQIIEKKESVCIIPQKYLVRPISIWNDLHALFDMIRLIRKEKPIIIHSHTPKAGMIGMLAAWWCRIPIRMHTVAGMPLLVHKGLKRALLNSIEKLTYSCATKVYPNSFELAKIILTLKLAPKKKITVIANGSSNGINTNFFSLEKVDKAKISEIKDKVGGCFTFIFVGRIVRDKGIVELVEAFHLLQKEHPEIRLLLVGMQEPELDPIPQEILNKIKNNTAIFETGWQTDVRPWFAAADALSFPSYREGFPNVVMQAGAMSLPAVVTDINGCNEIIIDGENGYIVPPRNTQALYHGMKKLIENTYSTAIMAQKARFLIADRYEQKAVWNAMLEEYQKLIDQKCK